MMIECKKYESAHDAAETLRDGATLLDEVALFTQDCFTPASLVALTGTPLTETQRVAQEWLLVDGKRWRPLLTAAVFAAAGGNLKRIKPAVVAVECFHKASLVHDDIQDGDAERYGTPTVHAQVGVPAAINVGDYLLGEGYRLLAQSDFTADKRAEMVLVAAKGHRELCLGQGEELAFSRTPAPLTVELALRICQQKTAAAFEVSVLTGAVAAGVDVATRTQLRRFSQSVGIAYQIQDDLADFETISGRVSDLLAMRPTLFLAAACASDNTTVRQALQAVWSGLPASRETLMTAIESANLRAGVQSLFEAHRLEAATVLDAIKHVGLKALLQAIMARMF